eukprot:2871957-Rhodomonas_salina.1
MTADCQDLGVVSETVRSEAPPKAFRFRLFAVFELPQTNGVVQTSVGPYNGRAFATRSNEVASLFPGARRTAKGVGFLESQLTWQAPPWPESGSWRSPAMHRNSYPGPGMLLPREIWEIPSCHGQCQYPGTRVLLLSGEFRAAQAGLNLKARSRYAYQAACQWYSYANR